MVNTSQSIAFHSVNANVQMHDHDHTIMNEYICYDSSHFYTISHLYVIGMSSYSAKSFLCGSTTLVEAILLQRNYRQHFKELAKVTRNSHHKQDTRQT